MNPATYGSRMSAAQNRTQRCPVEIEPAGRPRIPLATAYVPFQTFGETFPPCEALAKGTLFPCLYRPCK